jgi:endopolyphosphatase
MSLVNMTFDWLKKEWADEVDFVVWTGDNAR